MAAGKFVEKKILARLFELATVETVICTDLGVSF